MTFLWFLVALATITLAVLAMESEDGRLPLQRPTGLITWLTQGNWPAKVGGALVIIGVGALLRYALLSIDVPPSVKLGSGVVLAMALGLASSMIPAEPGRRAVSLALGGAAFGVAYLTAYSAFALFGYLDNPAGIGLLGVTAAAGGAYAVTRSALSLGLLSMVGAYLAPAFALTDPGPAVVYGYYVGASLLTLAMVTLRGWHPLIHLSFLFTLAGGVFFAWTSEYYGVTHADVMLPVILVLSAVHVAMPIAERTVANDWWFQRLDLAYTLTLPAVAAVLCTLLAPDRVTLSGALLVLGGIWAAAAITLLAIRRDGAAAHGIIAGLLAVLAVAARFRDLPWELLSLALSVAVLAIAARARTPLARLHGVLAGLVVLFGAVHILASAVDADTADVFLSWAFVERMVGAALLVYAGITCRRIGQQLDTLLLAMGLVWGAVALGIQVVRWDLATVALVVHWVLIVVAVSLWIPGRKVHIADRHAGLLAMAILATAFWSAVEPSGAVIIGSSYLAATLALIGMAVRPVMVNGDQHGDRLVAAIATPWTAVAWGAAAGRLAGMDDWHLAMLAGVAAVIVLLLAARRVGDDRAAWLNAALGVYGPALGGLVALATLVDIAPGVVAVVLEIACLGGLLLVARMRYTRGLPHSFALVAAVLGAALILQANLMRVLGPPGHLDISDLTRLRWPAVISLLWVMAGCALTVVSRRVSSRPAWVAGAALLVAAAAKLVILDFGSLGQLVNILAVILAGAVFLLVGWLAPMPPPVPAAPRREASSRDEGGLGALGWTTTVVLGLLAAANYSQIASEARVRDLVRGPAEVAATPITPSSPQEPATAPVTVVPEPEAGPDTGNDDDAEPAVYEAPAADLPPGESTAGDESAAIEPPRAQVMSPQPLRPATEARVFTQYATPELSARQPPANVEAEFEAEMPPGWEPELPGVPETARGAPVHVVGVYEGTYTTRKSQNSGRVLVRVKGAGQPIVLVLSSYSSVEWVVTSGGHRIAAVLLSGYEPSTVSGIGEVTVLRIGRDYAYGADSENFPRLRRSISRYTGSSEIRSFQGGYSGVEFSVGP